MTIIGEKLNLVDGKGNPTPAAAPTEEDEEMQDVIAKEYYKSMQEKSQKLIAEILSVIDLKHEDNIEMAKQLHKISMELADAKDAKILKGEPLNENSIS